MLKAYRRHRRHCRHSRAQRRRELTRCDCPVWVDGRLKGERTHKSLGTTDWQRAQQLVLNLEAEGEGIVAEPKAEPVTIQQAWTRFLTDLEVRKLHPSTIRKYRLLRRQMQAFTEAKGFNLLKQLDTDALDEFRSCWKDAALSACKKLERMRSFFKFAQSRKWVAENPASELQAPKVALKPTMPFTQEEVTRILGAVDQYTQQTAANGVENAQRLQAFILILRFTGMRISDVVNLNAESIKDGRLLLYTQKTGVPVHIVLPEFVLRVLDSTPRKNGSYFFWSGLGKLDSAVRSWQTRLRRLFQLAGVEKGHAHRFRDSFAVALLLAGIPIERVSILLGHQSTRVTEKHYNPWVRSRQEQLDSDLLQAWSRDSLVLLQQKVTRRLHGERRAVN